jgi:hypothetical protein
LHDFINGKDHNDVDEAKYIPRLKRKYYKLSATESIALSCTTSTIEYKKIM